MKLRFDVRLLIHTTMLAFAVASLGNVHSFFSSAGHPDEVAWSLAIALGSALVTLSIMLTEIDRDADTQAFFWLLATALLLGAISGSLQMAVYQQHLAWQWAVLLGFGIPLGGEVCLAFATSAYLKARERERFRNMSGSIETAVADYLERALAAFDPAVIEQHVERTINRLTRLAMDSVAAQALRFYATDEALLEADDTPETAGGFGPQNLKKAQAARAATLEAQTEARKAAILKLLAGESLSITTIADTLGIHRDTARKYCQELADAGLLAHHNRQWRRVERQDSRKA